MGGRALVLDMDGVVLRHKGAAQLVTGRVVKWVQHRLRLSDGRKAAALNDALYTKHGHTWRGLTIERGPRASGSLDDFNRFVYDDGTLQYLHRCEPVLKDCRRAMMQARAFCKEEGVPMYIYSNASATWCQTALDCLGTPDVPIIPHAGRVKPDPHAFVAADSFLRAVHGENLKVAFVDDNGTNLLGAAREVRWDLWHYTESATPFRKISSLRHVQTQVLGRHDPSS